MKTLGIAVLLLACTACVEAYQPSPARQSYDAFVQLLDEEVQAGHITPAQANWAAKNYYQRLLREQQQLEAAQDAADSARLGNALEVWRAYFGPRR